FERDVAQPDHAAPERIVAAPEILPVEAEPEARSHQEAREDQRPARGPVQRVRRHGALLRNQPYGIAAVLPSRPVTVPTPSWPRAFLPAPGRNFRLWRPA